MTPDKSAMLQIMIMYGIVCVVCFRQFLKGFVSERRCFKQLLTCNICDARQVSNVANYYKVWDCLCCLFPSISEELYKHTEIHIFPLDNISVDIKVTPQNPKLTLFERFIWQMPAFNVNVLRSARNSLVIRTIPVSSKGFVSSHTFSMVKAKVHWPTQ